MKTLEIKGQTGRSDIHMGESLDRLSKYLPDSGGALITDNDVAKLYKNRFPDVPVITIGTGESVKTLETVLDIYAQLMDAGIDRSGWVAGIGGGIVCDITGFVASTFLRGVKFGFVPTTLLAQVDASVGGKNGVNFKGYKNMIGVFNQPEFVLCDLRTLRTLPKRELLCGLAEVVKHAAIADADLFDFLERTADSLLALDEKVMERVVFDAVSIKSEIVNRDEKEIGIRRMLNFGHTFGHAVEKIAGRPHGEAVSIGMAAAAGLSVKKGLLPKSEHNRITNLLERLGLPTRIALEREKLLMALQKDKKRDADMVHFVLLRRIGNALVRPLPIPGLVDDVLALEEE